MPPPTTSHHHLPAAKIYPPPPTTSQNISTLTHYHPLPSTATNHSQNISTTTHRHLPPAKIYPSPSATTQRQQKYIHHHQPQYKIYPRDVQWQQLTQFSTQPTFIATYSPLIFNCCDRHNLDQSSTNVFQHYIYVLSSVAVSHTQEGLSKR